MTTRGLPYPKQGDQCTLDKETLKTHTHHHCPVCGAISNIHYLGGGGIDPNKEGCLGCDLCIPQNKVIQ